MPVFSVLLSYTLWRAQRSKQIDSWYVMCHWQICDRRSRIFIYMLLFMGVVSLFGWVGHTYRGMMKEAVYALVGGGGVLTVMVTVLVLILMESDILHQAALHKLPDSIVKAYPNPGVPLIEESSAE